MKRTVYDELEPVVIWPEFQNCPVNVCGTVESTSTALTESQREIDTVAGTNLSPVSSWIVVVVPLLPAQDAVALLDDECVGDGECEAAGLRVPGGLVVVAGTGAATGEAVRTAGAAACFSA
ncbi:MAG TPA: hypothetical protein VFH66_10800 [Mycobacteriales bacterium]|nr:hypothetical protein [Mycobacteriales bacterium]